MALSDEVIARFSTQRLKNLTNPDAPSATSYDATRLATACTDAAADFEIYAGTVFDVTDARHVPVAIRGVVAYLHTYTDNGAAADALKAFRFELKALAKVTGRDRILPYTDSALEPSPNPREGTTRARPAFDDSVFDPIVVQPPTGGSPPSWDNGDL